MMGWSPQCYIPRFVEIGPPVPDKKIFEGFFTIYGHDSHLGHVTSIMSSDFHFLVPESFHTNLVQMLCILRLRMAVKGLEMTWAESFRYLALKPSNLVVLSVLIIFFCFRFSVVLFDRPGISIRHVAHCICRVLVFASS